MTDYVKITNDLYIIYWTTSCFQEPQFDALIPNKGLVTGGNWVTIIGGDLNLGNNATVYVNDVECPTQWYVHFTSCYLSMLCQ